MTDRTTPMGAYPHRSITDLIEYVQQLNPEIYWPPGDGPDRQDKQAIMDEDMWRTCEELANEAEKELDKVAMPIFSGGGKADGLQKCPYCGSDTRLNKYTRRIGKAAPHLFQTAQVKCKRKSCGMSGPLFKGEGCRDRAVGHWSKCQFNTTMLVPSNSATRGEGQ